MNFLDPKSNIIQKARDLLPLFYPNIAIVEGILEGKIAGNIIPDEKEGVYLISTASDFNFVIGNVTENYLKTIPKIIPIKKSSFLVNCNNLNFFSNKNYPTKSRIHFSGPPECINGLPEKIAQRIAGKYILEEINQHLFDKCEWKHRLIDFYNSKSNFLKQGYGVAISINDQIIAEIYGTIGGNFLELGAYANPINRGSGLVPLGIAQLIKPYCLKHNLSITASCAFDNIPSKKTIKRLGLQENFSYDILELSKFNN
ncbi:MAG: zmaR [Francisellaceae bacterium]|nr:zmaR [Francisellaceae bacterium]